MAQATPLLIAYENLVDKPTTVITATSANTKFPASNVRVSFRQVRWRSTSVSNQYLRFDFGTEKDVGCVVLLDHNLTADAEIGLYSSTDNFVTDEQLVFPITNTGNPIVAYLGNVYSRYLAIKINDPGNPNGYLSVGKAFLGPHLTSERNYDYGWSKKPVDLSQALVSLNGVEHVNEKPQFDVIRLPFRYMSTEQMKVVETFIRAVGIKSPFFITLDADEDVVGTTFYVKLTDLPEFRNVVTTLWDYDLIFKEQL